MHKTSSDFHKIIQEEIERTGASSLEDINRIAKRIMEQQNNAPLDDFDGLSPHQMYYVLHHLFAEGSVVRLNRDVAADIALQSLLLKLCIDLLNIIQDAGELKLTAKGFLPAATVRELYDKRYFPDGYIDRHKKKLLKETDFYQLWLVRLLCELDKLTKKRKNKLSLTGKCKKVIKYPGILLADIFDTFCNRFNWAFFDAYESEQAALMGAGYSLYLLKKYGEKERNASWYAEKYSGAFPQVLNDFSPSPYRDVPVVFERCYVLRTFERGFNLFGLAEVRKERLKESPWEKLYVKKTRLFDEFVIVEK